MRKPATTRKTHTTARRRVSIGQPPRRTGPAWTGLSRDVLRGAATALGTAVTTWLIWWLRKI